MNKAFKLKIKKTFHSLLCLAITCQQVYPAYAQVSADGSAPAPNRPGITSAPNDVPMVNIVSPNGAGVSHNKYTGYNVGTEGLILNNSKVFGLSQLGGMVAGNPNLTGAEASLIINEVTSTNPSLLKGFTEVFGSAANVVVANPNGITCNGCGFLNTPKATLATGTPQLDVTGALSNISINRGSIVIGGSGLDATSGAGKAELLARAIEINADIHAGELKIITGRNDYDPVTGTATPKIDDGSVKPAFALDSSALGGMYAGKITLVGTEAGVGFRLASDMATSVNDLVITADGRLEMTGDIAAKQSLAATSASDDIVAAGTLFAEDILDITAAVGTATLSGGSISGALNALNITAQSVTIDAGAILAAGAGGTVGDLTITATDLAEIEGSGSATGNIEITSTTSGILAAGDLYAANMLTLGAANGSASFTNNSTSGGRGGVSVTAQTVTIDSGSALVSGLNEDGSAGAASDLSITSDAAVTLNGKATATQDLTITSLNGNIASSGSLHAGDTLDLAAASGNITFSGDKSAGGLNAVNISGQNVTVTGNAAVIAGLQANGTIAGNGALFISAQNLLNDAALIASSDSIAIEAGTIINDYGSIYSNGNISLTGAGGGAAASIQNISGLIESGGGDIDISATSFTNRKDVFIVNENQITYDETFQMENMTHPGCNTVPGSTISPEGCAYFPGAGVAYVPHPILGTDWMSYYSSTSGGYLRSYLREDTVLTDSPSGSVYAAGNLAIAANTISNDKSYITAGGNIHMTGASLTNTGLNIERDHYVNSNGGFVRCYGGTCRWLEHVATVKIETTLIDSYNAKIMAGGNFTGSFTGLIDNETISGNADPSDLESQNFVVALRENQETPSGELNLLDLTSLIAGANTLFTKNAPDSSYIFETRFAFTDLNSFYGSDYFLQNVLGGYDPEDIPRRLGDAYYDTLLIREAVMRATGLRFIDSSITDAAAQLKFLIDNGLTQQGALELSPGISLTAEQIAALTSDIVWYVEEEFEGEIVLVPRLYIASGNRMKFSPSGAIIAAAGDIGLEAGSLVNYASAISAGGNLGIDSEGDVINEGGRLAANGNIRIVSAGGSVVNVAAMDVFTNKSGEYSDILRAAGVIEAGGSVEISAGENIVNLGSRIGAGGDASLTAGGDVLISSQEQYTRRNYEHHVGGKDFSATLDATNNIASEVSAGGNLDITAGNSIHVRGSDIEAGGDLTARAVLGDVTVESAVDTYNYEYTHDASGFRDVHAQGSESKVTNRASTITSGGDTVLESLTGDVTLIASEVDSGGDIELSAAQGGVNLLARKDSEAEQHSRDSESPVWVKSSNKGSVHETVRHTLLTGEGELKIIAANGVTIDYKATGNLDESIDQLSQAPGLAWMADLRGDPNVDWNAVREIHYEWSESHEGLSGPAAAVIAIAIAVALPQMGLAGSTLLGGFESAALTAAADAGFTSLVSQASLALINNKGNLGDAFDDLATSEMVRSIAASMLTAGLATELGGGQLWYRPENLQSAELMTHLQQELISAGIKTGVDTVVSGEDFSEAFESNLRFAGAAVFGASFSKSIGELAHSGEIGRARQLISHAIVGCMTATIGGADCGGGATGAALGEGIADLAHNGLGLSKERAGVIGRYATLASAIATADEAIDVTYTNLAGSNAISNNFLLPGEKWDLEEKREKCSGDEACIDKVTGPYQKLSDLRDKAFLAAGKACEADNNNCADYFAVHYDLRLQLTKEGNQYYLDHMDEFEQLPGYMAIWHTFVRDQNGNVVNVKTQQMNYTKYIHPWGYEVVLDETGNIITDPVNAGTYNFYNPSIKGMKGNGNILLMDTDLHKKYDVNPYTLYGNSAEDITTMQQRQDRIQVLIWEKFQ